MNCPYCGALKKEGKLIRVGSNKTGHWQIIEEKE